jgi:hypothetical protein
MTDKETIDQIFAWLKEGENARDTCQGSPYSGQSLAHQLHAYGWVKRDLQLALCVAKPSYSQEQLRFGNITEAQIDRVLEP